MIATTWRKQAACRGLDVEAFYPVTEDEADAAEAKAVCAVCPVRQACLEHALAHREREGSGAARPSGSVGGSCASAASRPERNGSGLPLLRRGSLSSGARPGSPGRGCTGTGSRVRAACSCRRPRGSSSWSSWSGRVTWWWS